MKSIGFLSFGHWTPASQSQTRSAADTLLQSIDHVGRIVVKRRHPDRVEEVDRFITAGVAAALESYRNMHPVDERVLRALRVTQELHEYCYAASHLPRWLYVPDAALPALLRGSGA